MAQFASGTSPVASSSGGTTVVAASSLKGTERHARITVDDLNSAFASFDGGITKHRISTGQNTFYDLPTIKSVILYTDSGDLAAAYVSLW